MTRRSDLVQVLHPVYVIEGPDCSGKTTLANELARALGAKQIHLTYRWRSRMDLYHRWAYEKVQALRKQQPVILDRWWPSEVVYAKAFRGGTPWPMNARHFDRMSRQAGFHYVFCLPEDRDNYFATWMEERQRRYADKPWALKGRDPDADNQLAVYDLYRTLLRWMDALGRRDVTIYDRFQYPGQEVERAAWQIRKRTTHRNPEHVMSDAKLHFRHAQLVLHPRLQQLGRPRHQTYPGVQWSEVQRDFDKFLEANGVPDHLIDFGCPRDRLGTPIPSARLALDVYRKPAVALTLQSDQFAELLNGFGEWEDVIHRILPYKIGLGAVKALGMDGVKSAAHRLGLD